MSEKKTNTGDAPEKEGKAAVFDKAEIIASAKAFGATPELMAGALTTIAKDQVTKQEATDAVAAFRKRPVERGK